MTPACQRPIPRLGRLLWWASLALLLFAPPAMAALPDAGARFTVHDHRTKGDNWHVQLEVSPRTRLRARSVVLYVQQCKATAFASGIAIGRDGAFDLPARPFPLPAGGGEGTWSMSGRFTSRHELRGSFQISAPACEGVSRDFVAHAGGHGHGDGHVAHGGGRGLYPDLASATPRQRAQARDLWRATRAAARRQFPEYASARSAGYARFPKPLRRPVIFHLRHHGNHGDRMRMDPRRPESLVYWWPRQGRPVLIGFMYRAPLGRRPAFAGKLLAWHSHVENGRRGDNQMTHVWLTGSLKTALADCVPTEALAAANPRFEYRKPAQGGSHESHSCRRKRAAEKRAGISLRRAP